MLRIPSDYTLVRPEPGLALIYRQGLLPLLEQAGLNRFPSAAAAEGSGPGPAAGRSAARRVELGDGQRLVIKNYRRGGLLGQLRGNRYLGTRRQCEEIRVCEAAQRAGIKVPLIQCLWVQKTGWFTARLAAATLEISDARDLFRALGDTEDQPDARGQLLTATAGAVRGLHDAGIHHPDLNLGNILVTETAAGDPQIHLIDFDKASLGHAPLSTGEQGKVLTRMYRSLVKLSLPDQPLLGGHGKELFLDAYWPEQTGSHTALRRRCRRELALHRLWWRLSPPQKDR